MIIENEGIFRQSLVNGINLFLGAGFSALAKSRPNVLPDLKNLKFPMGDDLKSEIIGHFKMEEYGSLNLAQISQILTNQRRDEFYDYLIKRLTVGSFDPKYKNITSISLRRIFSVNIDDLIFRIFEESSETYIHDVARHGTISPREKAVLYHPLHGSVINGGKFIFTPTEISTNFSNAPDDWHLVRKELDERDTIFWGFALQDADVLQALQHAGKQPSQGNKWFILRDANEANRAYFRSLNFQIIEADTSSLLDYFGTLTIKPLPAGRSEAALTLKAFSDDEVPKPHKIPAKPIKNFFLGAAPSWSDVSSGQLHVISTIKLLQNEVAMNRCAILVGMPLCGKTTLLMQAAFLLNWNHPRLFMDSITVEKANFLLRTRPTELPLTIFVDNFVDSVDAMQILMKGGVQVIASDRSYRYESVAHRFRASDLRIIDMSDLSSADAQALYDTIPQDMKKQREVWRVTGENPYVFEIINNNIAAGTIRRRFKQVLRDLEVTAPEVLDLLIMMSYFHDCRCTVSFDMIYLMIERSKKDYGDVTTLLAKLKNLVKEIDDVDDPHQDYYRARSSAVAETVMGECSSTSFRRVFERVHNVLSPS